MPPHTNLLARVAHANRITKDVARTCSGSAKLLNSFALTNKFNRFALALQIEDLYGHHLRFAQDPDASPEVMQEDLYLERHTDTIARLLARIIKALDSSSF